MAVVDELLRHDPEVHTELAQGVAQTYGLHASALRWLEANVRPDWRTLETGCGMSTVVFAATGADHITISPFESESDQVRDWCADRGISTGRVTFVDDISERVLPGMDLGDLDLVLVDGAHAFPQVFIDWYYASQSLRVGGLLLIDDLPLWTGYVLHGFLRQEPGWEFVQSFAGRIALFRKTAPMDPMRGFRAQPYVASRSAVEGWRCYVTLARHRQFRHAWVRGTAAVTRRLRSAELMRRLHG